MSVLSAPSPRVCKPASKPVRRTIQVVSPGRIAITHGKVTTTYAIAEFPVGDPYDGQAFRLTKDFGDTYDVFLHRFGQNDSCDCIGFEAHGRCKHVSGLLALMERGKLDDVPAIA
jgi:hypothetical protein